MSVIRGAMKAAELLRRLNRLARRGGWPIEMTESAPHKGAAQWARLDHSARSPRGTLHAILTQLGITREDLEG